MLHEIIAWVGFTPLFFALRDKTKSQAFLISYVAGVIFWSATIYWLVNVTFLGTVVLILYLALYFGAFGLIFRASGLGFRASPGQALPELFFIPAAWVILEYIRSHLFTGFPWALLGYSQYRNLLIIQIADITGAYGVSFLVMMVNVSVYVIARSPDGTVGTTKQSQKRDCFTSLAMTTILFSIVLVYGSYKLTYKPTNPQTGIPLTVTVIQGNIPQELKWDTGARDFIVDKYLRLSEEAVKQVNGNTDLIIWPEAALPAIPQEDPGPLERVKYSMEELNQPLLLGLVTKRGGAYYNSALLFSGDGEFEFLRRYDKVHLVPFGEYIPLKKVLPFLEAVVPIGDFTAGKDYAVFNLPPVKFAALICFEDVFPELARKFRQKGAEFLVNITNDAWFGKTGASYQHLQASVFRAVENRVSLARAANTGVSAFIASTGKIVARVADASGRDTFVDGYKTGEIYPASEVLSFYTRYGDLFVWLCLAFVIVAYLKRLSGNRDIRVQDTRESGYQVK